MLVAELELETPDFWTEFYQKADIKEVPPFFTQIQPGIAHIFSYNPDRWLGLNRMEHEDQIFESEVPALVERLNQSEASTKPHEGDKYCDPDIVTNQHGHITRSNMYMYGVVDTPDQFCELFHDHLSNDPRSLYVCLKVVAKQNEPDEGGWVWDKWGPYYGTQKPQMGCIADEPDIDAVYCYQIYEVQT